MFGRGGVGYSTFSNYRMLGNSGLSVRFCTGPAHPR